MKCCLCGDGVEPWPGSPKGSGEPWGYGHNPAPLRPWKEEMSSRCCNWCNENLVIPLRLHIARMR